MEGGMSGSGAATSGTCAWCARPLTARVIGSVDLESCDACKSLLLKQAALMPALGALSAPLLESFDADAPLQPLPDRTSAAPCPGCGKAMEKADYCAAKVVYFERCDRCELLWIGHEELGAMSLMWARMEKRIARTRTQTENDLSGMDAQLHAARLEGAVAGALGDLSVVDDPFFGRVNVDDD
jgi:hypothetical protein